MSVKKVIFRKFCKKLRNFFVFALIFSLLYVELIFFIGSASMGPIEGLAIYLNPKGNDIENAVGRLAITDEAHLLVKGEGKFELKIYDFEGKLILTRRGKFNSTGYAKIVFRLSPEKFEVNKEYVAVLEAFNEPLPLILRFGKTEIRFTVKRDVTKLGIGFYKNSVTNETVFFAKLMDEANPIAGRKIKFEYKRCSLNESFKMLGESLTDEQGIAEITLGVNDSRLLIVKAEFEGDDLYEPSAIGEVFTDQVDINILAKYVSGALSLKNLSGKKLSDTDSSSSSIPSLDLNSSVGKRVSMGLHGKMGGVFGKRFFSLSRSFSTVGVKVSIKPCGSDSIRTRVEDENQEKSVGDEMDFNFDYEQMTLVEFLDRITMDGSPASLLIDIAEIMSNPCDLPYVVHKLQVILSKLSIALIPMIDGDGIVLYRVEVHEVVKKVAKQVTETVTEVREKWVKRTKTVYKRVAKRIRVWRKLVTWVKERKVITYRYWDPLKWRWVTVRQIYYVWVPKIKWRVFWKTVYETVAETITCWVKVTETITRAVTKTVYETVRETVKENVNVYRIKVFEGKVIDLETGKETDMVEWFLSLIGIDVKALKNSVENGENPLGSVSEAFKELFKPFIEPLISIGDILCEWFSTWMRQIAYAFTARIYVNMITAGEEEKVEGFEPKVVYYWQDFDEFDLIKSLSPIYRCWKDELTGKVWYVARSTYAMPTIARVYLKLNGPNSIFNVLYTTETLVELENGKIVWVNCKNIGLEEDGDGVKVYTIIEEDGRFMRREIKKDLGVTRRIMLTYYMENGELKAIPTVYLAWEKVPLDGDELGKVKKAIETIEKLGENFRVTESDTGKAEIIAITDLNKAVESGLTRENYHRNAVYCFAQLLDLETKMDKIREKLPEVLSYDERFKSALESFAESMRETIGDRSPRGGIAVNALITDLAVKSEGGEFTVYSMVEPYYCGKGEIIYVDPTVISSILSGEKRGMKIIELAGYSKIVEENGEWRVKPTAKKGEIHKYYKNWRENFRCGRFEAASLGLFCHMVSMAELFSLIYGVNVRKKMFLGELDGKKVEVSLRELIDLKNKVSEGLQGSGRDAARRRIRELSDEKLRIIRVVTGVGADFNLKEADPSKLVDIGLKVIETTRLCQRSRITTLYLNLVCRNLSDIHEAALKSAIEGTTLVKIRGPAAAWVSSKMTGTLLVAERTIRDLDERIEELKKEIMKLDEHDPKVEEIRREINSLEKLKYKLEAIRSNAEKYLGDMSKETVKKLASESGRMVAHGYLMYNGAQFMLLGGMTLAITLIRKCAGFFMWLEENEWAKILLGACMTAIFVVGLNIDTGWMNKVCGKFKVGAKELVGSIAREAVDGNNLLDKSCFVLGMLVGGFGMVMETLGIQFYTTDEICEKIGEYLNRVASGLGDVWKNVMGLRIPFVDQTLFDILLGLALGGPMEVIGDTIMGVVINRFVGPMLNQAIISIVEKLLVNYI